MFDRLANLVSEHAELENALADPAVHSDQEKARTLGRRYAELTPIVHAYREWQQTSEDEEAARELAREDSSFAAEAEQLAARREELEAQLRKLLVPRDPNDGRDLILEVKAGEGGDESALFAGDLLRMYQRYAERRGWKTEILDSTVTGLGGIKDATVVVKGKGADGAWSRLKYEGGVHRVQRVPVTESQGRIHTSAAGVLVAPEADPVEVQVNENDLKIDVFRSSGPGRAEREHHRLGRADHPPADRHRRLLPEREEPAAEQGAGDARAARAAARARPRPRPTRRRARNGAARCARWTGRSASAPTTSRRTASRITGWASRPTTSTRSSTVTWTPVIDALAAADLEAKLTGDDEPAA